MTQFILGATCDLMFLTVISQCQPSLTSCTIHLNPPRKKKTVHLYMVSLSVCFVFFTSVQIGSFFMINLCLVVIATQFSETKQREHQLMQEQRAQCLSSSTLASMAEPGDCYEEIFQLVCHVLRKAKRRSAALYYTLRGKPPPAGGGRGNRRGGGNVNGERHHSRHPRCE